MKAVEAGAALASMAAAAGYYFYGTKNAKKHRQAASAWAKGMKKDVMKKAASVKKLDAKTAAKIVDEASKAYKTAKGASLKDVQAAALELKKNWKNIETELAPSTQVKKTLTKAVASAKKAMPKKAAKQVKKAVKTAKKAVKKAVRR